MLANAKNVNAQKDLAFIATAEEFIRVDGGPYIGYDSVSDPSLERATVCFTPSAGT
ncbi:hypothetical protein KZI27_10680 [Curtobacterium sp. TC1]|uniref:hypothetical protein n=1 Tax=Curtobacterium sp. TC1 TaxID=2862880 RepID=UPI001C9AE0CF|nr:hypothetical protein [Curtobacterium sp. TC1]QZQ53833.1 hypothetical protein KZI27_10680 [Curtobacterium sp. TC1]